MIHIGPFNRLALVLALLACVALPTFCFAAHNANWRVFRAVDGLTDSSVTAVSVSPKGNVWASHSDAAEISMLDGYTVRRLPAPSRDSFRIYESQTGQLWSIYPEGLMLYDGTQWIPHPIGPIRAEIQRDLLRQIRQIPLVAIQHDRVLFLLSDKLMEYDASRRQTILLKEVGPTGLGRFLEMTEVRDANGRDRALWITGQKGIGKLPRPRQIAPDVPWQQLHVIGDQLGVENLRRPFEFGEDQIIVAALMAGGDNRRVVLRYDGQTWTKYPMEGENIWQAWPGWDGSIWAFTINSLLRFGPEEPPVILKEHIGLGQFKDVAIETNGVFWLAASEGLARYAPFAWRTPKELETIQGLVHAILVDDAGTLWFATAEALIGAGGDRQWKSYRWPNEFAAEFRSTDTLYELPDHRLAITARDGAIVFDPRAEEFFRLVHGEQRRMKLIGKSKDNKLWVQTFATTASAAGGPEARLEQFDGRRFFQSTDSIPDFDLKEELYFAAETQNGDLWIGGNGGVARRRNGEWTRFGAEHRFSGQRVFCWLETADGKIWCGAEDRILEFDGNTWSTLRSGLERVTAITRASNGRTWIATGNGLHCYAKGSWVLNGTEEGLPSAAVSKVLEDKAGRIWVGTTRGITLHHPGADPHPPKTFSPTLNTPASAEGPISLTFHAMDKWHYTPTDRLLFSYRIDEGQWSAYTNASTRTFDQLRAGKHRFEVRAMDRNWNEDPSFGVVEFSVVMPWYKESRLVIILLICLVLVLFFAGLAVNRNRHLIRSYAEVEKIVAQRTFELERANQEVLHSQKMRALGTLAAGIAHDFNNILSIIKGSAQIIESHLDDKEKIRTRVNRIKTVVDQGAGIVRSMLGLTRGTNQDFVQANINEVVDQTVKVLGDRFLQEVIVRFEAAPELPPVLAVKELIQQMLLNLILNAADAMSGFGEVVVSTAITHELPENMALSPAQADVYVSISVQDTGCGIAPDVLPRIFEPFFTTKAFSTRRGTGLGLSMVYQLAKEMGYGLKVMSAVGKGSTFLIFIPVRK